MKVWLLSFGLFQTEEKDKKKMISFTFLLCSTLLLSGAIAAPYPDATSAIAAYEGVDTDLVE